MTRHDVHTPPPPTPKPILAAALLLSIALFVGTVFGFVRTIRDGAWLSIGFEGVLGVSAVIGVIGGLGGFRASHALTFASVGGAAIVCGVMAFVSSGAAPGDPRLLIRAIASDPLTASRLVAGASMFGCAGLILLLRRPRESARRLAWAALLGAPPALCAIAMRIDPIRRAVLGLPPIVLAAIAFFGFFLLGGLVSVSLHNLIRAFEIGRAEEGERGSSETPAEDQSEPSVATAEQSVR